jgi:hypothetical protein
MSRDAFSRNSAYALTPCGIPTLSPGPIGNVSAMTDPVGPKNMLRVLR